MAERRMFSKAVIDSDLFLDLPLTAQALYFHLAMRADDDGFVNNPKKIARMIGADYESIKILCINQFLIPFETGVVVIRHWKIQNFIPRDRYHETVYKEEKETLKIQDTGLYESLYTSCIQDVDKLYTGCITGCIQDDNKMSTECIQDVDNLYTEVRLGKYSINNNNNIAHFETEFDTLWKQYPRKEGKAKALKAYIKSRSKKKDPVSFEQVQNGIKRYVDYIKSEKIEPRFIKHGSTWFGNESWNDVYETNSQDNLIQGADGFFYDENGEKYI